MLYSIETFYVFKRLPLEQLNSIKAWLTLKAKSLDVLGLIILGTEGLNTTLASQNVEKLDQFVKEVSQFIEFDEFSIKKSESERAPFRKFVVKLRPEIVSLGKPEFVPSGTHQHLSPEQWHEMLEKDVVVVDTRNDYEIEIGTFKNAVDLEMKEFSEFPDKIAQLDSDKEKPHLIFCTGGIRCEKAIFEMEQQGYKQVYQLDGGILNYMEAFPEGHFEGECFVFDSRVSVDQNLKPSSQYSLCPQCGEVGSVPISCRKCGEVSKLCKSCLEISKEKPEYETCSKNCRHHYKLRPDVKGPQQKAFYHFKA